MEVSEEAVTLCGQLPRFADRLEAEHAAWTAQGVLSAANTLVIAW